MSHDGNRFQISRPVAPDAAEIAGDLAEVLASGQLTNGRHVRRFEELVSAAIPGREIVALSSNTTGMLLAWRAFGLEGEVLVPSFTFPATVHALEWNGLRPVLVDCDPGSFTIDIEDARRKLTAATVGIAPVYIFGTPPDWAAIEPFAAEHELRCVADAAHAFGTRIGDRTAGSFGDVEIFSLAPTKVLTTGEGGIAALGDADLAEKLRRMRNYGNPGDYDCRELGLNGRMSEIHALLGVHGMPRHEAQLVHRRRLADVYRDELSGVEGIDFQRIGGDVRSTHNYFAILVEPDRFGMTNRELQTHLLEHGVESKIYFHPPIHRQRLYRHLADPASLPKTEWVTARVLCLPLTNHLEDDDVRTICRIVRDAPVSSAGIGRVRPAAGGAGRRTAHAEEPDPPRGGSTYERIGKRALDVALSSVALVALFLPFLLLGLAIRLESRGPVLYRQTRVGRNGVPFQLLKLRSMVLGAETRGAGIRVERADPRITRVGKTLRRTSIDELPQLVNVFRGDMSIVGPRPGLPFQAAQYTPEQRRRLLVRPGITGWAQVNGRNRIPWDERIRLDVEYVERASFALDLLILRRTVAVVLSGGEQIAERAYFRDPAPGPAEPERKARGASG